MRLTATYIGIFFLLLSGCSLEPKSKFDGKAELEKLKGPEVGTMEASLKQQAEQSVNVGDYKRAAQLYKQLSDKSPDNKDYSIALADNYRRSGDYAASLRITDALLKKDANNAAALENKGLCLMGTGEFVEAGKIFEDVMKLDDKRWRTLNAIGILFAMKNMTNDSVAYYNAALVQSTNNASVLNNLGLTLAMDRQYDQAVDAFERARRHLNNGSPEIKNIDLNMALVYAIAGKLEEAEQTASPHLSKAGLYNNMGFYAYLSKNTDLSKSYLNMALTQSPVYYERAWKNLSAVTGDNSSQSNEDAAPNDTQPLKTTKTKVSAKHKKEEAKTAAEPVEAPKAPEVVKVAPPVQEDKPVASSSGSLGQLPKDEPKPAPAAEDKPKEEEKPVAKEEPKPVPSFKDTSKSLGTLPSLATSKDQGQPLADIPAKENTTQPVPPSPVMNIPLEQVPATAPVKDQGTSLNDIPAKDISVQTAPGATSTGTKLEDIPEQTKPKAE